MKVLHIINNLASGGAEKLILDILPLLNKSDGLKADLLILSDKSNVYYEKLVSKGTNVFCVKYKCLYDPRNIFEIAKKINEGEYDIVHSHLFPTQYWVSISKLFIKDKNVKYITTEHSTHNRRRDINFFRYLDRAVYSIYDYIVSITNETQDNLIKWYSGSKLNIDKHIVIENGINLKKIKKSTPYSKYKLIGFDDENAKIVCMVGRFSEAKDQISLIKAMKEVSKNIHLIFVGEGPLMNKCIDLVNQVGLEDRVHFLGFREDVYRIMKTSDIIVLSSNWEGFGLSAVEGMAAGKVVLISDVPGLNKIVEKSDQKFEKGNHIQISNIINRFLLDDRALNEALKYSRIRCEKYDINKTVRSYIDLYNTAFNFRKR